MNVIIITHNVQSVMSNNDNDNANSAKSLTRNLQGYSTDFNTNLYGLHVCFCNGHVFSSVFFCFVLYFTGCYPHLAKTTNGRRKQKQTSTTLKIHKLTKVFGAPKYEFLIFNTSTYTYYTIRIHRWLVRKQIKLVYCFCFCCTLSILALPPKTCAFDFLKRLKTILQ